LLSFLDAVRNLSVTLSDRVKLARTKRGLNQRELADKTRLSRGYISMLEKAPGEPNAVESPGLSGLQEIAKALNVSEEWLILGREPEPDWEATAPPPASERNPTPGKEQAS
jgi:transcriptional regulator with XRE-family HTH domain